MTGPLAAGAVRHPHDPEPIASTKATAVLVLGVAAVVTGPLVGGIVPAVVALLLARQARAELIAGRGFLTGAGRLRRGELAAIVGLCLGLVTLTVAAIAAVLGIADGSTHDVPNHFD